MIFPFVGEVLSGKEKMSKTWGCPAKGSPPLRPMIRPVVLALFDALSFYICLDPAYPQAIVHTRSEDLTPYALLLWPGATLGVGTLTS